MSCGNNGSASTATNNTNDIDTSIAAKPLATPVTTPTKKVDIVDKYVVEVPEEFSVKEILSSPIMTVPTYIFETSAGSNFSIFLHPYMVSSSPIPGKCVVSTAFDAGTTSAPVFCEGLELISSFTIPAGSLVKYGDTINDLSLNCTMNSPCPMNVPANARYVVSYVFVIADKPHATILEFYTGDAFRGPSNVINGFEGLGAVLHDLVIPSLSARNP